jgi:hypothetical protein
MTMRESLPPFNYDAFKPEEEEPTIKLKLKDKITLNDGHEYEG